MKTEDFYYSLPRSLVAQYPSPQRGASALMMVNRREAVIEHQTFQDLPNYLKPGDLLVMNDTRVLPARLIGTKSSGGKIEMLLISPTNGTMREWNVLIKGSGKVKPGARIEFSREFYGEVEEVKNGRGRIQFVHQGEVMDLIRKVGRIPLPPYIKREDEPLDKDRYQTVFAAREGSIAAPTAGLHFTHHLFQRLRDQGVRTVFVTLQIGLGTFVPVKSGNVEDHTMDPEWAEISEETSQEIEQAKARGGRVIAVGTTTVRALESFSDGKGGVKSGKGWSSLFIYPPYRFRVVEGLITNFHLPKSTLIMLVAAFAGKGLLTKAYQEAVKKNYRFYSYGDAMLIL